MYLLDLTKLQEGDIVLTRSDSSESRRIRDISGGDYSHAIIYVGLSSCIESDGLGVQADNILRKLFDNMDDAIALRIMDDNPSTTSNAIEYARRLIGTEYSVREALSVSEKGKEKAVNPNKQFCTRLVAQSYEYAGYKLVENSDYCSPDDLLNSTLLKNIEDCLTDASEEQVKEIKEGFNPLKIQVDIHNEIFEGARNISNEDIQTFEQLYDYVLTNETEEDKFIELIERSGYLQMWRMDVELHPYHYDISEFNIEYQTQHERFEVGNYFAETEVSTRKKFEINLSFHKQCLVFKGQKFFKVLIELDEKLIELSKIREEVGRQARDENQ